MKLQILAACAALVPFAAGQALAADTVTATLAAPVPAKMRFVAGGALFNCEAAACVALAPSSQTFGATTCKAIAARAGAVTAFEGRKALDAAKLADCNARAATPADPARMAGQ